MARKNIIEFIVKLVDEASADLKKLESGFIKFSKNLIKWSALAATATLTLAGTFLALYNNMTKRYAEFNRFSKALGISVERLSQLEYAAKQVGVSMDTLKRGVEQMSSAIDSAEDGVGVAADAIAELGINAKELNKLEMYDQFLALADAFQKLDSATRKNIISQDIFGEGSSEMVRLLNLGSGGLERYAKESDELGRTLKSKTTAEAERFQQQLAKLQSTIVQLQQTIINEFGPALTKLVSWLVEVTKAAGKAFGGLSSWFIEVEKLTEKQLQFQLSRALQTEAQMLREWGEAAEFAGDPNKWQRWAANKILIQRIIDALRELNRLEQESVGGGKRPDVTDRRTIEEVATSFPLMTSHRFPKRRKGEPEPGTGAYEQAQLDKELATIMDRYQKIRDEHLRTMNFMQSLADQAARGIQTAMADFFFDPFSEGLDGMLKQFINVIRRMIAEWLAFQTLNFFNIGGFFSKITGMASGGPVTAGTPYIVGERGPELFVPGKSGSIVPGLPGGMGGMNFVTNIDARGADPSLISRLPQIMENRDRRLMLKMKEYVETGGTTL